MCSPTTCHKKCDERAHAIGDDAQVAEIMRACVCDRELDSLLALMDEHEQPVASRMLWAPSLLTADDRRETA